MMKNCKDSLIYYASTVIVASLLVLAIQHKVSAEDQSLNTLTPEEQQAGWKLLFDGKTTNGWRNYKRKTISDGWKVIDGALTRVKRGGDIVTVDQYDDFELSLEYKISKRGNSGIKFHVLEDARDPWPIGPEVQILDNKYGSDPQKAGWLYQLYKSDTDATKPAGEWNQLRIVIDQKKSEVFLNGVKYYEFVIGSKDWNDRVAKSKFIDQPTFGKSPKGYIDLQDHDSEVAFRNIKLRLLPAK
jgi:hypothetical protein